MGALGRGREHVFLSTGIFPLEFSAGKAKMDDAPAIPDTIHLIPTGQWEHDLYGSILITSNDIQEFIENFNSKVRKGVFITAGHEGMQELPAVGWITKVEARDTGLWGEVEWNEDGEELLETKAYKFFSPEFYRDYEDPQTHKVYRNVLTGGALTKSPYFKELEAIVFSEPKFKNQFKETAMNIKDLLAKKKSELTAEEKAFLKENKSKMSEEESKKYDDMEMDDSAAEKEEAEATKEEEGAVEKEKDAAKKEADEPADDSKIVASEKVMISASELTILRQKADEGQQAFAELKAQKLTANVNALTFSENNKAGKFLPKSTDTLRSFMESLNDAQVVKFTELLKQLPKTEIFSEVGGGDGAVEGTAKAEVDAKVEKKMSENKDLKFSDALKQVMSENEGLEERYDRELVKA